MKHILFFAIGLSAFSLAAFATQVQGVRLQGGADVTAFPSPSDDDQGPWYGFESEEKKAVVAAFKKLALSCITRENGVITRNNLRPGAFDTQRGFSGWKEFSAESPTFFRLSYTAQNLNNEIFFTSTDGKKTIDSILYNVNYAG